jgi:uncharacterized OsmC-like protein
MRQYRKAGTEAIGLTARAALEVLVMENRFDVTVSAGTMTSVSDAAVRFPHRWTPGGVTVEAEFTGAHLLHLAAAGCVLNDVYREAAALGIGVDGVRVTAEGGFDASTWQSTGIAYSIEVGSDASADQVAQLLEVVDQVAEIPRAIRAGAAVQRES